MLTKSHFQTGTFYQDPTMGGYYNQKNDDYEDYPINTADDRVVIKKMDSFSGAASMNSDTYLVYFVGTQFATHQYSCRFAGIFEQKTKEKELTLVDSYKKLGCNDLTVNVDSDNKGLSVYGDIPKASCQQFCDGGMGPFEFSYMFPHKKSNKHHH